jgi:hypothetical protein
MLIKFTDSYENYLYEGRQLVGRLVDHIASKEPFVGGSIQLDRFYALSIAISAIIEHLEYDDNSEPKYNEYLLEVLKELLTKNLCGTNNQLPDRIINTLPIPVDLNKLNKKLISNPVIPSLPTS